MGDSNSAEQEDKEEIRHISFNQTQELFTVATERGFTAFKTEPIKPIFSSDLSGGVTISELYYRTNFMALVGGDQNPKWPNNAVNIWDDEQKKVVHNLPYQSNVLAIRWRNDIMAVVLENRVYVYSFPSFDLIGTIDTVRNPNAICALNPGSGSSDEAVLAIPDD